jgi:hypothetical protein
MEVKIMLNVPKNPKNQKNQKFFERFSKKVNERKPKIFFERFLKKVNIIAVKTQKFKNQNF